MASAPSRLSTFSPVWTHRLGVGGILAVAIYRMQRALRKSRTPRLWTPAYVLLAVARKLLQIVTGLDLHPRAEIGAGLMILHGSQIG